MLNLNRATLSLEPINVAVNDAIERATAATAKLPRPYLGASMVGSECLRKIQYDWWCSPAHSARTREIFARGHYFEERSRQLLCDAGFKFAPFEVLSLPPPMACSAVMPTASSSPAPTCPASIWFLSCGSTKPSTPRIGGRSSATGSNRRF